MSAPRRPLFARADLILGVLAGLVFFALRDYRLGGGDSVLLSAVLEVERDLLYQHSSPLSDNIYRLVIRTLEPWGWSMLDSVALCTAVAGAIYVATALSLTHRLLPLAALLVNAVTVQFNGHVEIYAFPAAFLLLWLRASLWQQEGRVPLGAPAWMYVLATLAHKSGLFLAPALLYFYRPLNREMLRALLPSIVALTFVMSVGPLVLPYDSSVAGTPSFTPLFEHPHAAFTMFSVEHLLMVLYFYLLACPIGLALVIWYRRRLLAPDRRWLALAALCGVGWMATFYPGMQWEDWDLFAMGGIPVNLLGAVLLLDATKKQQALETPMDSNADS